MAGQWLEYAAARVPALAGSDKKRGLVPAFKKSMVIISDRSLIQLGGEVNTEKLKALANKELPEEELTALLEKHGYSRHVSLNPKFVKAIKSCLSRKLFFLCDFSFMAVKFLEFQVCWTF
jgi:hypothetical protein